MCVVNTLYNVDEVPEFNPPEYADLDSLLTAVYTGGIGADNLPQSLFDFTAMILMAALFKGFGLPTDFEDSSPEAQIATLAKRNLGLFSGAKTFQNVVELSTAVFDENDQVRPFSEFKKIGLDINDKYNVQWLKVEQQAAVRQSQSIGYWLQIEQDAELFPFLTYQTVGDSRVRPSHKSKDGITRRWNDSFWDTWFPPNGFRCRCIVTQRESGTVDTGEVPVNEDVNFDTNVGKTGLIFSNRHPYNEVPAEYRRAAANGFGFTVPTDKDVREYANRS